jgi:hypothetical protein
MFIAPMLTIYFTFEPILASDLIHRAHSRPRAPTTKTKSKLEERDGLASAKWEACAPILVMRV